MTDTIPVLCRECEEPWKTVEMEPHEYDEDRLDDEGNITIGYCSDCMAVLAGSPVRQLELAVEAEQSDEH